jgi:peptidoglycan hydrolase CwlO-like protein
MTIDEWASLTAIIVAVVSLVGAFFRYVVFAPIQTSIKELSTSVDGLKASLDVIKQDYNRLDRRIDEHDRRLDRHHEQIKTLYNEEEKHNGTN